MAKNANLYYDLWTEIVPEIISDIKEGYVETEYDFDQEEFEERGNRKNYSFYLNLRDGDVINNIDGSAVARDLYQALCDNSEFEKVSDGKDLHFKLDKNFTLCLNVEKHN